MGGKLYLVEESVLKAVYGVPVLEQIGLWDWLEREGPIIRAEGRPVRDPQWPNHIAFETRYGDFALPSAVVEELEDKT